LGDKTRPTRCVIGDVETFASNPHGLRALVLVFVEPVEMKSSAALGCRQVEEIVDVRTLPDICSVPLLVHAPNDDNNVTVLSDMHSSSSYRLDSKKDSGSLVNWAKDNGEIQIGMLCRDRLKDCTWLMWVVNRAENDQVNPAKAILEQLQRLPLRGPGASVDQLLRECKPSTILMSKMFLHFALARLICVILGPGRAQKGDPVASGKRYY
jgi:hypothetical protein